MGGSSPRGASITIGVVEFVHDLPMVNIIEDPGGVIKYHIKNNKNAPRMCLRDEFCQFSLRHSLMSRLTQTVHRCAKSPECRIRGSCIASLDAGSSELERARVLLTPKSCK